MSERVAAYFGSRNLYGDMLVSAKSLLKNAKIDRVFFLIEDDDYPYEIPSKIETINAGAMLTQWFRENGPNWNSGWTPMGLVRVALTKVFPQYDKVLTIDCDTIVLKDISDLWDIPLDDYWFAAVKEPSLTACTHNLYINAGVALMNLKKLREDEKDENMIGLLNNHRYTFVAQDAMNAMCQGGIYELPGDYNASRYTIPAEDPKIIHYAGCHHFEWREKPLWKDYEAMEFQDINGKPL